MVFLFMFLASVVLFESFSASYTSFLSVVKEAQPFETISELEQTSYLIGAQEGTAFQSMFSVNLTKKCLWLFKTFVWFQAVGKPSSERLANGPRWSTEANTGSAIERMQKEDYAFMQATTVVYLQLSIKILISFE